MTNISTQKQRIINFLEYKGISKNKFYIKTGISNGVLDKKSGLSMDTVEKFYSIYKEVNPEWLLTGKGSMLKSAKGSDKSQELSEPLAYYKNKEQENQWLSMIESKDKELRRCHEEIGKLKEIVRRLQKESTNIKEVPD